MSSLTDNHKIYAGRAIAAPMVRVSCLGFRVLCAKQGADACFSEELVSLKLKKTVREVVSYPVPLPMLPLGYRLPASAVETAILSTPEASHDYKEVDEEAVYTRVTSIYLAPYDEDEEEEDQFADNSAKKDATAPSKTDGAAAIGDVTCYPEDLAESILARSGDGAVVETNETHRSAALASFRQFFGIPADGTATTAITVSAEALTEFLTANAATFLPPTAVVAHIPAAEMIMYEPFKKGYRRAVAASFLPKRAANPFPEGDRRPEAERFGSVFSDASSATNATRPRVNDIRCVQVVGQLGAANATDAALAASVISPDVDGIDVNMGCPKAFSVQNGMGAALMKVPATAGQILRSIHCRINSRSEMVGRRRQWWAQPELKNLSTAPTAIDGPADGSDGIVIPISFKTRIFGSTEDSLNHLATVVANCIRPRLAPKRGRDDDSSTAAAVATTDGASDEQLTSTIAVEDMAERVLSPATEEEGNDASTSAFPSAVDVPCPLHAISLHARTREQRSESDPLTNEAVTIMDALRSVEAVEETSDEVYTHRMRVGGGCEASSANDASNAAMGVVPVGHHIPDMTFIFNGSVAANGRTAVPNPTFHGALVARHCMWDMSVFNNYAHITHYSFARATHEGGRVVAPTSAPTPVAKPSHMAFQDAFQWALPPPSGRTVADWLAAREKVTDAERHAVREAAAVYIDLLRNFAAYHNNSMYAKYHYTRSFAEFPFSKLTCHELEFLLVRDEETTVEALTEAATAFHKLSGKARGDAMTFTKLQGAGTWMDFYMALKHLEEGNWGLVGRKQQGGADAVAKKKAPFSKAELCPMDRFLFNVTPRGDEVLTELPAAAVAAAARK